MSLYAVGLTSWKTMTLLQFLLLLCWTFSIKRMPVGSTAWTNGLDGHFSEQGAIRQEQLKQQNRPMKSECNLGRREATHMQAIEVEQQDREVNEQSHKSTRDDMKSGSKRTE